MVMEPELKSDEQAAWSSCWRRLRSRREAGVRLGRFMEQAMQQKHAWKSQYDISSRLARL